MLTLRILDAVQEVVRSPLLPRRIRGLCSHQSVEEDGERELAALIRLWIPLLLTQVGPGMRPQLVALFSHALQRSMSDAMVPAPWRELTAVQRAESGISRQLATGMVDALLDLSRQTGKRLGRRDEQLEDLSLKALDRFWEELARTLEQGPVLERSQELVVAFLEELKRNSVEQLRNQGGVEQLITELDGLSFQQKTPRSRSPA